MNERIKQQSDKKFRRYNYTKLEREYSKLECLLEQRRVYDELRIDGRKPTHKLLQNKDKIKERVAYIVELEDKIEERQNEHSEDFIIERPTIAEMIKYTI